MSATEAKKKLSFSVDINASREKIWETLTGKETFSDWCSYFNPSGGSYYEGDWSEGSSMRFLGPDQDGNVGGMITKIVEHRPGEYIRSDSVGVIGNGQEYYEGDIYDEWVPATEEYRLTGGPNTYTLTVNNDVPEPYVEHFSDAWKKGLARVKSWRRPKVSDLTPIEVNDELDLVLERTISLSVEEIWTAWTTPELLKQWFVPKPWGLAESDIDFRPGGKSRVVMQSPEGERHEYIGCILEAVPFRRIVYTDVMGPGYSPSPEPFMVAIVEFEKVEGGTRYRAVSRHANVENRQKHEEMGFHSGWGAAIDQMVELMTGIRGAS